MLHFSHFPFRRLRMNLLILPAFLLLLPQWGFCADQGDAPAFDMTPISSPLPRAVPESEGVPSEALEAALTELNTQIDTMNSLMVIRHGKVIAEAWWYPHTPETPHALFSVTKSFMSTAIGMAAEEGKLSLDDQVIKFFPGDLPIDKEGNPAVSENLKKMTVRHLLTMTCGHDTPPAFDTSSEESLEKQFLKHTVDFEPGTHFQYNTPGCYILSAIFQKAMGETTESYLRTHLFEPLDIAVPFWTITPQGVTEGGSGLFLRTEEIAKFGLLTLQKGKWNGKQIVSPEWFSEAVRKQVSNGDYPESDWGQGYGYLFWRCRHNAYRADGMLGQYCIVIPDKDMLIVSTADTGADQQILNIYWDQILAKTADEPLPENDAAYQSLLRTEKSLTAKPGTSESCEQLDLSVDSKILGRNVSYSVYLPKNYMTNGGTWKVLYLLHGLGGDHLSWFNHKTGKLKETADSIFREYPGRKLVIVSPNADRSWYINSLDGDRYEDFFVKELIPEVEKICRIRPGRENRFIGGLSMGGYGSLHLAVHHPELFSRCYAISAAVRTDRQISALEFNTYMEKFGNVYGVYHENDNRFTERYRKYDLLTLVDRMPEAQIKETRFFLDCGDDDHLIEGNLALFFAMKKRGIPVELRVRDGGHNWVYFRSALPALFEFISEP